MLGHPLAEHVASSFRTISNNACEPVREIPTPKTGFMISLAVICVRAFRDYQAWGALNFIWEVFAVSAAVASA